MEPTHRSRPIEVTLPPFGVFVLESHHAPGFRMADQSHDFLEIFYVLEGRGAFHIDGRGHHCQRSDMIVVPLGSRHHIEDDPAAPLTLYGICLAPHVWQFEPTLLDHLPAGRLPIGKLLAAQVHADLRRLLFEQTLARPCSRILILGLAQQLLALLAQSSLGEAASSPNREPKTASQNRRAVERYVAELPLRFYEATDLDHAAEELDMSRRSFTQLFRQVAGTSWTAYMTRLRVNYACQLLRESSRSIIATAFECGFEDLSSFYRAFKRQTGLPPRAWRNAQAVP